MPGLTYLAMHSDRLCAEEAPAWLIFLVMAALGVLVTVLVYSLAEIIADDIREQKKRRKD